MEKFQIAMMKKLKEYMHWDSIEVEINLKLGNDAFKCFALILPRNYIDINADYEINNDKI